MILGTFECWGEDVFATALRIGLPQEIRLKSAIFDWIHVKNRSDIPFTAEIENWGASTVLRAHFQNNLSAGNLIAEEVTELRFKKKRAEDFSWITFATVPFDINTNDYSAIDRYPEAKENYIYAVVPYGDDKEGAYQTASLYIDFSDCFVQDATASYRLLYNLELGEMSTRFPSGKVETLSGKYPIISYSSNLNYVSGSVRTMLVSDATANGFGEISAYDEKILRRNIMQFLTNKQPKIIKDGAGNYLLIAITGDPSLTPNKTLDNLIYDLSFNFVEIGDPRLQETLTQTGLL